jgi:hypothetical protein
VNAPGRRHCRECGGRLGAPCTVCTFYNGFEDKYCGGCGRRLKAAGPLAEEATGAGSYAPALTDDMGFGDEESVVLGGAPAAAGAGDADVDDAPIPGHEEGVSQSEIDGLFENILDDEPAEGGA